MNNEIKKNKSSKKIQFPPNNGIIKTNFLEATKTSEGKKVVSFTSPNMLNESNIENKEIDFELKRIENLHINDKVEKYSNFEWDKFNILLEDFFNKFLNGKSESDLTIYNFKDMKEKNLELLSRLFDSVIENQQIYVDKKKNDLQRDYEKHFNKYAPGYNIIKCSLCKKSELFNTILISEKCKHPLCIYCLKELNKKDQHIFINEGDQKIKLDVPYFNCPLCNQINPFIF